MLEFCRKFFPGEEIFTSSEEGITVHIRRLQELERMWVENGRLYHEQLLPSHILEGLQSGSWLYHNPSRDEIRQNCARNHDQSFLLTPEMLQILEHFHLVLDPQAVNLEHERRPYFRMRGRPVTPEQAFDILSRTGLPFSSLGDKFPWKNRVYSRWILDNQWFDMFPHGWVFPDGRIGVNDICGFKYPYESEIMTDLIGLELAFPYLDLIIAITDWDEAPTYVWNPDSIDYDAIEREDYPDFAEHIICGLWLHDSTVELMAAERAQKKYLEYNRLYGGPDEEIFKLRYYKKKELCPVDAAYLRRMIRAHGLDPDEVLEGYEWGPLGLRKPHGESAGICAPEQINRLADG